MNNVLIITSTASMILQFNLNNIKVLKDLGKKVYVACNFLEGNTCSQEAIDDLRKILKDLEVEFFHIPIPRNPVDISEIWRSYSELLQIVRDKKIGLVHCQSPVGGVLGRLVARKCRTKVIYTAHGFHFYKGAPVSSWLLYYPIEKYLSKFTDIVITINNEDFSLANKRFKAKYIRLVPGIGIDVQAYAKTGQVNTILSELTDIQDDAVIVLSVGELNCNKNHEIVVKALGRIKNPKIHYVIAGIGENKEHLKLLALSLGIIQNIHFLGYVTDIKRVYHAADLFCFPSFREGLSVALMEAMASGLPIICSRIRGNSDLVVEDHGGLLCDPNSIDQFESSLSILVGDIEKRYAYGRFNQKTVWNYDSKIICNQMKEIYEKFI